MVKQPKSSRVREKQGITLWACLSPRCHSTWKKLNPRSPLYHKPKLQFPFKSSHRTLEGLSLVCRSCFGPSSVFVCYSKSSGDSSEEFKLVIFSVVSFMKAESLQNIRCWACQLDWASCPRRVSLLGFCQSSFSGASTTGGDLESVAFTNFCGCFPFVFITNV